MVLSPSFTLQRLGAAGGHRRSPCSGSAVWYLLHDEIDCRRRRPWTAAASRNGIAPRKPSAPLDAACRRCASLSDVPTACQTRCPARCASFSSRGQNSFRHDPAHARSRPAAASSSDPGTISSGMNVSTFAEPAAGRAHAERAVEREQRGLGSHRRRRRSASTPSARCALPAARSAARSRAGPRRGGTPALRILPSADPRPRAR